MTVVFLMTGVGKYVKRRFFDESRHTSAPVREFLHSTLATLSSHPDTAVYVVSGMDADSLGRTDLAEIPSIGLSAENGVLLSWSGTPGKGKQGEAVSEAEKFIARPPSTPLVVPTGAEVYSPVENPRQWQLLNHAEQDLVCLTDDINPSQCPTCGVDVVVQDKIATIKAEARRVMEKYRCHIAGSTITEGPFSISWSYRNADPDWGSAQSNFLIKELNKVVADSVMKVRCCVFVVF